MKNNNEIVDRVEYLKNSVAPILNAEFYPGITDIAAFFKITEELNIPVDSSAIVGSIDGFSYCLCEYKKNNESYTLFSIVLDEKLPYFTFATKDFYIQKIQDNPMSELDKIFDTLFLMITLPISYFLIVFVYEFFSRNGFRDFGMAIFLVSFFVIIANSVFSAFKRLSKKNESFIPEEITVPHDEFKEKYDIVSDNTNSSFVEKKFDYDFCESLLNYQPEISYFRSIDGVLQFKSQGELLNTDNCLKVFNSDVGLARQFKNRFR